MSRRRARLFGQLYHYVDDFDLDGSIDIGSTTHIEGEPHAPVGNVTQFFYRAANRGEQFRGDYQKLYDEAARLHSSTWANDIFCLRDLAEMTTCRIIGT